MREQPIVYVKRKMFSYRNTIYPIIVGYVVSKAYLQSETTRYFPNGDSAKEYEVEFIGYAGTEKSLRTQDVYLESGAYVNQKEIFEDFESCKQSTSLGTEYCFKQQNIFTSNQFDKVIDLATDHARHLQLIKRLEENFIDVMEEEKEM